MGFKKKLGFRANQLKNKAGKVFNKAKPTLRKIFYFFIF